MPKVWYNTVRPFIDTMEKAFAVRVNVILLLASYKKKIVFMIRKENNSPYIFVFKLINFYFCLEQNGKESPFSVSVVDSFKSKKSLKLCIWFVVVHWLNVDGHH